MSVLQSLIGTIPQSDILTHLDLPPAPQNPYQSRFSQSAVRQFLAANAASQQAVHTTPYTPHVALPQALPDFTYQAPHPHTPKHVAQPEVIPKFKLPKLKRSKSQVRPV